MDRKIFAYCERATDPSFWAEPLNAITNVAFFVAAFVGLVLWMRRPPELRGAFELYLIVLVFAIGTGSFLFHTYAEPWAAAADTIPIGIFMVSYLGYALRRYLNWNWIAVFAALLAFFGMLAVSSMARCNGGPCFNGSLAYAPALAALVAIGGWLMARRQPEGVYVLGAGVVFSVSLTFRTIDRDICAATDLFNTGPLGTHMFWHVFNALLLGMLLTAAIRHGMIRARV